MIAFAGGKNYRRCTPALAIKACLLLTVCFVVAPVAFGQVDPLKPSNMPEIDTNCTDYPANVWVTGPLYKLRQDSGTPPSCPGAYAGKWYVGYGTQNEFVDFQVHWHATPSGTTGLTITVSNFVQTKPNRYTINCGTLGQCVVYREAYVNVRFPTIAQSSKAWNTSMPGNVLVSSTATSGTNGTSISCSSCNFTGSGVQAGDYASNLAPFTGQVARITGVTASTLTLSASIGISSGQAFAVYAPAFVPDVLIPAVDPYWGQTTNAWPFTVASNQNQSAWIDVLIPQGAPAGYYSGSVTVQTGCPGSCTTVANLPIVIGVWQWPTSAGGYMPSTSTLKVISNQSNWGTEALCTQMYAPGSSSTGGCGAYPGGGGDAWTADGYIKADAERLMIDHRYTGSSKLGGPGGTVDSGSFSAWEALTAALLNGTCNLHNGAGTICPVLPGAKATMWQMAPSCGTQSGCISGQQAVWQNWKNEWNTKGYAATLWYYLKDEPQDCLWAGWGTSLHGYINPGIANMVTTDYNRVNSCSGQNSVDLLVTGTTQLDPESGEQNLSNYTTWVAASADGIPRLWFNYHACGDSGTCTNMYQGPWPSGNSYMTYPNLNVDNVPVANRAMEWTTFLHGQVGELYYNLDFCDYPGYYSQCVPTGVSWDPWSGLYYSGGWGDGTVVYTGSTASGSVNYMGSGVTIPLILPSLRLKLIRDGVQDYEYLNILKNNGQGSIANAALASWMTNTYTYNVNPTTPAYGFSSDLTDARNMLGNAMHQLTHPAVLQPPPRVTGVLQ